MKEKMTKFELINHFNKCPEVTMKCESCGFTIKKKNVDAKKPHDVS